MRTSSAIIKATVDLLTKVEGFSPKPYYDVLRWSWGFGTQVPSGVTESDLISIASAKQELEIYLKKEIEQFERILPNLVNLPIQIAILSKGYQYGSGIFSSFVGKTPTEIIEHSFLYQTKYLTRRLKEIEAVKSFQSNQTFKVVMIVMFCAAIIPIILAKLIR